MSSLICVKCVNLWIKRNNHWHNILCVIYFRFSIERSSPSSLEMRSGKTARLPCQIVPPSALQSVNIQWTKDGQILTDSRWLSCLCTDLWTVYLIVISRNYQSPEKSTLQGCALCFFPGINFVSSKINNKSTG